jgi:hypothetical protein
VGAALVKFGTFTTEQKAATKECGVVLMARIQIFELSIIQIFELSIIL